VRPLHTVEILFFPFLLAS